MKWLVVTMVLVFPAHGFASQAYAPPPSGEAWRVTKVYLKPAPGTEAQGVVAFLCNEAEGQHRVQVYAKGLQSGEAYALWLRRLAGGEVVQEKRLTRRLLAPKADARGVYRDVVSVLECPLTRYNDLVLAAAAGDTSDGVLFGSIRAKAAGQPGE